MAVGKNELTLELGKHFLIIDSNKSFVLEDNQGFRAYRPAGAWQIDCWKLLPEEWHKIYPVYTLKIEWENSEFDKDYIPTVNATDLDLGDGIAGVSGQPVNITTPVTVANLPNVVVGEQNTVPVHIETNLQPFEVVNYANNVIDGFTYVDNSNIIVDMAVNEVRKYFIKCGELLTYGTDMEIIRYVVVKDCLSIVEKKSENSGKITMVIYNGYDKNVKNYIFGSFSDVVSSVVMTGLCKEFD